MMSNPRFPHTCTITKSVGDVQLGTATETLVYNGSCRKELNNFNDQNPANAANTAQWLLSMPVALRLEYGIKVVVDDGVAEIEGIVSDWETTNIEHYNSEGTFTKDSNGNVTSLNGITTVGMHIYVTVNKN